MPGKSIGRSVRGFTPAGRKPRHKVLSHLQAVEPTVADLCKLPGLRYENEAGDVVTVNMHGVPCGHDGLPAIVTERRKEH